MEVVKLLAELKSAKIIASEPYVEQLPDSLLQRGVELRDALTAIDRADVVVLLVDHRQYALIDPEALKGRRLIDTRGLWTWRKARRSDARMLAAAE